MNGMSKKKYYIFLNTKSDTIQTKFITKQRAETTEYTEDKKHPHTLMHPPTPPPPPHTHTHTHTHTLGSPSKSDDDVHAFSGETFDD